MKRFEILFLLAIGLNTHSFSAQRVAEPLPTVISAADPVYPPIARAARISGIVRLHLTTDGKRVSATTVQAGPAMLIPSAESYIRTWVFAEHTPTIIDVALRYNVQNKSECETGIKLNPAILHLPTEVEINTAPYCDSVRFFRNKKILDEQHAYAVELHFVLDGHEVVAPSEVVVTNHISRNTFHSVPLPVKDGLLLVPEKMANGTELGLQTRVGQDIVDIPGIPPSQLENIWTIRLADDKYMLENSLPKGMHWKSACMISFDPLQGDGIEMSVDPCHRPLTQPRSK